MFCFQCEQTAKGQGCTIQGVCGKKEETANLQQSREISTGCSILLFRVD